MLISNNLSPLPFYTSLKMQNHKKDYAFGSIYPLVTYRNMLLPFQYIIGKAEQAPIINAVKLINYNTRKEIAISRSLIENGLSIKQLNGYLILKYPGTLPVVEIKHEGTYYIEIILTYSRDNQIILYSELFSVCNNVDNFLVLTYSNSYNFQLKNGLVDFSDNFQFKCYLPTQVGKPEYQFEEEATERMGYTFIESQVSKKVYKFAFIAPEYLCDALRIVRLCDNKQVVSKEHIYDLTTFNMSVDWEDQGDLAAVECEFETDTVIANLGGFAPTLIGGDFNNDYNNDYKTK